MPSLVLVTYGLTIFLAVIWEPREQSLLVRILQLIPLNLFSVSAHIYLLSSVIEWLFLINGPHSESAIWNKDKSFLFSVLLSR